MEYWKDIKGFEGYYQISNLGRVKSLPRKIYNKGNKAFCLNKGRILKHSNDVGGYEYVILYKSNSNRLTLKIHRLVAFAFCVGYEEGLEVNHKDGNRINNNSNNLEWVTKSQNIRDKYKRGLNTNGEKSNASKLKNTDIGIIASLYDSGVTQKIIAKAFGVGQTTISRIINNKVYKNGFID